MNQNVPPEDSLRIGVVTISDRASQGIYDDLGGPAIVDYLTQVFRVALHVERRLVPDEKEEIAAALRELCDIEACAMVVTTGGTGPAARDVTPEAPRRRRAPRPER